MVKVADRAPVAEGVNVSFTVQEPLTGMVPPLTQVPVPAFAKLVGFVPVMVKYGVAKTCDAVPELETVSVTVALVVPTFWLPNATVLGLKPMI